MKEDLSVKIENLTKTYGKKKAVDHISLSVKNGDIFTSQNVEPGMSAACIFVSILAFSAAFAVYTRRDLGAWQSASACTS